MKKLPAFLIIVFLPFAFSCKQNTKVKESNVPALSTYESDTAKKSGSTGAFVPVFSTYSSDTTQSNMPAKRNEILYGVLTPVEICTIFNRLGIPYNVSALNPLSNKDMYVSNDKIAINTGVYGVDFGYLRMFGIGQQMIDYMVAIRELCDKLGIPDDYLVKSIKKVDNTISDPDTILLLMNDAYKNMQTQLRDGGRSSTAGLLTMGGWVEAMYIATQLTYNPANPDPEVVQNIAQQKYTLNSLLSFLKNYYDDPVVVYYSKKLKFLKTYFDSFDIFFKKGDLEIDTLKQVFRSSGSQMNITVETLNNIRDYVSKLRAEMIKP